MLGERGQHVEQAKDRFGERTTDGELLAWCAENDRILLTNNAKDFEPLHRETKVDEVLSQYGADGIENELVDLGEWYEWLHE